MYEILSDDYDRFVNWQNRLAIEMPFILDHLRIANAANVLDAATGTGMHAVALAKQNFQVTGADISMGMIKHARKNAIDFGVEARFEISGFGSLALTFGVQSFEAVLCLGNSLPHLLSREDLDRALADFAACLKTEGVLIIQNRNFDAVLTNRERWMEPQSHIEENTEWIFQRFYDFDSDGLLTFNMVILKKHGGGKWEQKVVSSRLRPILKVELLLSLSEAGFTDPICYGDMSGTPYDHDSSPNLVVVARKYSSSPAAYNPKSSTF
jgi:glycine/sarcosine N-methyltransferase